MKQALVFMGIFILPFGLLAQSTNAPLNADYYHLIDRYEIRLGAMSPDFFTAFKAYKRSAIASFADSLSQSDLSLSGVDQFNIQYIQADNWEFSQAEPPQSKRSFLKHFYQVRPDMYQVQEEAFDLHVSPVMHLSMGNDSYTGNRTYVNTRGVEVRGMIDKKVGFYTYLGENQASFPQYVNDYRRGRVYTPIPDVFIMQQPRMVPGEGFWKRFKEDGVDFFTARGYISVEASKHINFQFGHDRFSIGNGHRSLILSDFGPGYLFGKLQTKVWKFQYTNLFTKLTADTRVTAGGSAGVAAYPAKQMSLHHLSINIGKNLNIGVFEAIMQGYDVGEDGRFNIEYLNPIIFYRAIEQQSGSPDNAILGMDFKWNFARHFSFYGQFVLDEFLLENIRAQDGWWGNKFAAQAGLKYIDAFGIANLDLQVEGNIARPYIYTHGTDYGSWTHYTQPLAHPFGANFKEFISILRYQPTNRLFLTGKLIAAQYGEDAPDTNVGTNILLNYRIRRQDRGNTIGQGISSTLLFADFTASYMLKHNLFVDVKAVLRKLDRAEEPTAMPAITGDTRFLSMSLRLNIPQRQHEF
jgi:hypothetical protein